MLLYGGVFSKGAQKRIPIRCRETNIGAGYPGVSGATRRHGGFSHTRCSRSPTDGGNHIGAKDNERGPEVRNSDKLRRHAAVPPSSWEGGTKGIRVCPKIG